MALQEEWTFPGIQGTEGVIELVTFEVRFTDPERPGVQDFGSGIIGISTEPPLSADTATHEQVIDAVKAALGDRWSEIQAFHDEQLQFEYARVTAESYAPEAVNPKVTNAAVDIEADRRIADGFIFGAHVFQSDPKSKARITGAGALAGFAIANGAQADDYLWHGGTAPFSWIAADNTIVQLDAHQMFGMAQAAADWEAQHVFAARALKDMSPIPLDFKDDQYWP